MLPKQISKQGGNRQAQNLEGLPSETPRANTSRLRRICSSKIAEALASIGVLAICAAAFYRIRELLAALLLFSVILGTVIVAVLILWLVGEATHEAAGRVETRVARIAAHQIAAPSRGHCGHAQGSPPWN